VVVVVAVAVAAVVAEAVQMVQMMAQVRQGRLPPLRWVLPRFGWAVACQCLRRREGQRPRCPDQVGVHLVGVQVGLAVVMAAVALVVVAFVAVPAVAVPTVAVPAVVQVAVPFALRFLLPIVRVASVIATRARCLSFLPTHLRWALFVVGLRSCEADMQPSARFHPQR
jgi:hypothetical protein